MPPPAPPENQNDDAPSKSARKREMAQLQRLGEELTTLPEARLKDMDLPEDLLEAVLDLRRFPGREAKRRQLQYIGKLMRSVDAAPIAAALEALRNGAAAVNARHHALERWRERLLADETQIAVICAARPQADMRRLRQLRLAALRERAEAKPPRAGRELFRLLRQLEMDHE